jgi:hypothetical protein
MQGATEGDRGSLTLQQIQHLLTTSPSVRIEAGAAVLDTNLTEVRDLTSFLLPGSFVTSDWNQTIHRTCSLNFALTADVAPGDKVRPWIRLTDNDTGVTARFNLGLYVLTSPTPDLGTDEPIGTFTGYDLLQLLNQPIADTYELLAGQDPVAAAATLITSVIPWAEVLYSYLNDVVPTTSVTYSWPLDGTTTYLQIVNGLLGLAGYLPVYADWNGLFRFDYYVSPVAQPVEWVFDMTSPNNTVDEDHTSDQDLFGVPNWWRFVMNNLSAAPVEGTTQFTFTDQTSPITGLDARGYQVNSVQFVDANDYPSLVLIAAQTIERDLFPAETFNLRIFPLPLLWHRDIVQFIDLRLNQLPNSTGASRFCMVTNWNLPLDGQDQTVTLQTISPAIDEALNGS